MKRHCYEKMILLIVALVIGFGMIGPGVGCAYFGMPYTYSQSSYSNPLYSSGLLKNIMNPFGFGGVYNLTTSLGGFGLLGGSYGMGGLSGLYGMGGLSGLYGMGGLYGGLMGLYGSYGGLMGLYGSYGGLYGLYGMSGLGGILGLLGQGGLYGLNSLSGLGSLLTGLGSNPLATTALNNPFVAEQAGTWIGQWNLGFLFGTMVMNLQENPLTGSLSGTAQLIGNNTFSGIFNVFGTGTPTFVQLSGQDPTLTYAVTITAPLPTPTTMQGYYSIYKLPNATAQESGTFSLDLISAAVI